MERDRYIQRIIHASMAVENSQAALEDALKKAWENGHGPSELADVAGMSRSALNVRVRAWKKEEKK